MISMLDFPLLLNVVLTAALVIGSFFAFRNGRYTQLAKFEKETNDALQRRIDVLEGKITDLEKQNAVHQHLIDTISSALKQKGIMITIDGDMVTILDKAGRQATYRKRNRPLSATTLPSEEK